jgi:hypothetical protein
MYHNSAFSLTLPLFCCKAPTREPTPAPTRAPTASPTAAPTRAPTPAPTPVSLASCVCVCVCVCLLQGCHVWKATDLCADTAVVCVFEGSDSRANACTHTRTDGSTNTGESSQRHMCVCVSVCIVRSSKVPCIKVTGSRAETAVVCLFEGSNSRADACTHTRANSSSHSSSDTCAYTSANTGK